MKFVEFDKKGNPLPEYAKAHEWNLEFLRGFDKNKMSDSETQEKLDKMLADHIPHIFDDIMTYPIPDIFFNYPEGTEDEKVLDEVIRTCEMLVDRYGMKIFEANMRSLSLENVAKLKPVVDAYWKDNPKFQMLFDYSSNLYNLMVQIAQVKYGVNIAMGAKQIVNKQEGLSEKDKQNSCCIEL